MRFINELKMLMYEHGIREIKPVANLVTREECKIIYDKKTDNLTIMGFKFDGNFNQVELRDFLIKNQLDFE